MFDANGLVIVAVGALLCFYGVRSVHLGVLAAGFGIGWMVAGLFHASFLTLLLSGLIAAVGAWVVCSLVFRFASFFVGGLTGAVAGARLAGLVQHGDGTWSANAIIIIAVAVAAAFAADRFRARALLWLTSIGGASMVLLGLGDTFRPLHFLQSPSGTFQDWLAAACWIALSAFGWVLQRRLFAERLGIRSDATARS